MASLRCSVVAPTGELFAGEVAGIKGPGWEGGFGVLPGHAPYLVRLLAGRLVLQGPDGGELFGADIEGGFLQVARDECTVLVEGVRAEEPAE